MNVLSNVAASTLSLPPDTYIYSIIPTSDALVAISSDDSLSVFDKTTLAVLPNGHSPRVHEGVTCLHGWGDDGNYLVTAGRDSHIRCWDRRSQQSVYDASEWSALAAYENEKAESDSLQRSCIGTFLLSAGQDHRRWYRIYQSSVARDALVRWLNPSKKPEPFVRG